MIQSHGSKREILVLFCSPIPRPSHPIRLLLPSKTSFLCLFFSLLSSDGFNSYFTEKMKVFRKELPEVPNIILSTYCSSALWSPSDRIPFYYPLPCSLHAQHTGLLSIPPTNRAYIPASELLHLLFPLPQTLSPDIWRTCSLASLMSELKCCLMSKNLPWLSYINCIFYPQFYILPNLLYFSLYFLPLITGYILYRVYFFNTPNKKWALWGQKY